MIRAAVVSVIVALSLAACANTQPSMPLRDAMISTVQALAAANAEARKSGIVGLQACDVTAEFAITSANQRDLSLALKPPQIPLGVAGSFDHSMQSANTVTVDFKSPECIMALTKQPKAPQ